MKLIVGLGNPGRAYANNRHNVGFACLRYFARRQGIHLDKKQCLARTGIGDVAGNRVVLARPQTYMNGSGISVSRLVKKFDIDLGDLIVIHDDLDLPLGKIRIRHGGHSAGHKGVNSITTELENHDFIRIRVGIGRPDSIPETDQADIIDYVLGDFTPEERKITAQVVATVAEAILCLFTEGLTPAMNKYN